MERLLKGTRGKIRHTFTNEEGAAADATGTPSVTITRDSDGVEVVSAQSASDEAGTGVYGYTLSAANLDRLDLLTAVWTANVGGAQAYTSEHEVVGRHLCSLEAIAEKLSGSPAASVLAAGREVATELLEQECGVAFRPRYSKEELDADRANTFLSASPRLTAIRSVTVDGVALTADQLAALKITRAGEVTKGTWAEGARLIVAYEHGFKTPPADVSRAAVRLAVFLLKDRPSNFDERATSYSTEEAHYSLITPGIRGAVTSLPEVNAVIERHHYPSVG